MDELKKLRELALAYQNADTPGKHHGAERDWDYGVTPELILSLLERLEKAEADAKRCLEIAGRAIGQVPVVLPQPSASHQMAQANAELEQAIERRTKAWAGTPANWVDDLRGNESVSQLDKQEKQ
jgi:hypothetical protein